MENNKQQQKQSNGFAIAGFVLSFFFPILGIIFSAIGLGKANNELNGNGKGLSIAGLAISIVSFIIVFIVLIVAGCTTR